MICPRCSAPVAEGARLCPSCRAELASADGPTTFSTAGDGETTTFTSADVTPPHAVPADVTRLSGDEDQTSFSAPVDDETTRFTNPVEEKTGFVHSPDEERTRFTSPADEAKTGFVVPGASAPVESGEEGGPLDVGQAFGSRYHIVRLLGIGGMGAVYQAWDQELGVAVALKVVRPEATADPAAARELERRFKQELLLARKVTHKNVVRIYDLGEIDGIKYITMSYVEGANLASMLHEQGRLDVPAALRMARDIVAGLEAAHDAGIVHRDLKPANVMVEDERAVIMDFGIARSTAGPTADPGARGTANVRPPAGARGHHSADLTKFGVVVGTIEYMAPEQARGEPVDQRVDIYAFGLMFYDMLLGRRRATGGTKAFDDLQRRLTTAPPSPRTFDATIPEAIDRIITKCIQPDAAARYQTTHELAADLAALDERGEPIPIPPRFGKKVIAASAAAVVLLVGTTWWFTRTPPPEKPHDPVSVLIADVQNATGDQTFDRTLEPVMKMSLEGAGFISAFDRAGMRTLGVRAPERLDERAAQEIAVKQAVGVVLSGSLSKRGAGYELSVKASQAVTGRVIAQIDQRISDKGRVLSVAANAAADVRKALGDNRSDAAQRFAMDTLSATNLDAVHAYALGQEALSNNRNEEAIGRFASASAKDANFGAAYTGLAIASDNVGRQQDAEKYAKEALRHLDSMTERERYRARGIFYRVTGDYQHCVEEYGALVARYAADVAARNNLALCMSTLRKLPAARDEMRRVVDILPKRALYRINLSLYSSYGTDFETGAAEAQTARTLSPTAEYGFVALAFAQIGQGQIDKAVETYTSLAPVSPLGASLSAAGLADVAIYQGRFAEAAKMLERGAAADIAANNRDRGARKLTALAYTRLLQRQKGPAAAAARQALATSDIAEVRFLAARALIEAGQPAEARRLAQTLGSAIQFEPQVLGKIIDGDIALESKDARQAVKLLTEANTQLDTWIGRFDLGRAYLEAGAFTQADSEFDRCIRRRGEALALFLDEQPTSGYLPAAYYYQGRVREALKTEKFADSYRTYVAIRGAAGEDPLLPEVRRRGGL